MADKKGKPPKSGSKAGPAEKAQPAAKAPPGAKTPPAAKTPPGEKTPPAAKTPPGEKTPKAAKDPSATKTPPAKTKESIGSPPRKTSAGSERKASGEIGKKPPGEDEKGPSDEGGIGLLDERPSGEGGSIPSGEDGARPLGEVKRRSPPEGRRHSGEGGRRPSGEGGKRPSGENVKSSGGGEKSSGAGGRRSSAEGKKPFVGGGKKPSGEGGRKPPGTPEDSSAEVSEKKPKPKKVEREQEGPSKGQPDYFDEGPSYSAFKHSRLQDDRADPESIDELVNRVSARCRRIDKEIRTSPDYTPPYKAIVGQSSSRLDPMYRSDTRLPEEEILYETSPPTYGSSYVCSDTVNRYRLKPERPSSEKCTSSKSFRYREILDSTSCCTQTSTSSGSRFYSSYLENRNQSPQICRSPAPSCFDQNRLTLASTSCRPVCEQSRERESFRSFDGHDCHALKRPPEDLFSVICNRDWCRNYQNECRTVDRCSSRGIQRLYPSCSFFNIPSKYDSCWCIGSPCRYRSSSYSRTINGIRPSSRSFNPAASRSLQTFNRMPVQISRPSSHRKQTLLAIRSKDYSVGPTLFGSDSFRRSTGHPFEGTLKSSLLKTPGRKRCFTTSSYGGYFEASCAHQGGKYLKSKNTKKVNRHNINNTLKQAGRLPQPSLASNHPREQSSKNVYKPTPPRSCESIGAYPQLPSKRPFSKSIENKQRSPGGISQPNLEQRPTFPLSHKEGAYGRLTRSPERQLAISRPLSQQRSTSSCEENESLVSRRPSAIMRELNSKLAQHLDRQISLERSVRPSVRPSVRSSVRPSAQSSTQSLTQRKSPSIDSTFLHQWQSKERCSPEQNCTFTQKGKQTLADLPKSYERPTRAGARFTARFRASSLSTIYSSDDKAPSPKDVISRDASDKSHSESRPELVAMQPVEPNDLSVNPPKAL